MESSGKWPEEMNAIDKVKTAFYVHMAKALKEKKGIVASPTEDYLDILKVRLNYYMNIIIAMFLLYKRS